MKYTVKTGPARSLPCDCLVVAVRHAKHQFELTQALDRATRGRICNALDQGHIGTSAGDTLLLPDPPHLAAKRLLLVQLGKNATIGPGDFRRAIEAATRAIQRSRSKDALFGLTDIPVPDRDAAWKARQIVETVEAKTYRFDELKLRAEKPTLKRVAVLAPDKDVAKLTRRGVAVGDAIGSGIALARRLGDLPGNLCTPTYLADQARRLAKQHGLKISVLEEARMKALGMGALLSVSRGSREPAKLIVLEYRAGGKETPVALVGKGLTFDAGGISLKPAAKMDEMKYDMCGGASVLGTLHAVARLGLRINLIGVIPSSENLPDGAANKPGDVVTSMSGQTIEILNTDAEGRLILCDALTYTERFRPGVVIDIATLTGACVVALGEHASGLFSNNDVLAGSLCAAGEHSGDRVWRLPLWQDYQSQLDSNFADMANVGGRSAGAITAACFLARYAKRFQWAHLDIAGTAWTGGKAKGATGRPVALLTEFLIRRAGSAQT